MKGLNGSANTPVPSWREQNARGDAINSIGTKPPSSQMTYGLRITRIAKDTTNSIRNM